MNLRDRILNLLPELIERFKITVPIEVFVLTDIELQHLAKGYSYSLIKTIYNHDNTKVESFKLYHSTDIWNNSNNIELKGNLSHEFSHMILRLTFFEKHINKTTKDGIISHEIIADSIAINKGYRDEILANKNYLTNFKLNQFQFQEKIPLGYDRIRKYGITMGLPINTFDYLSEVNVSKDYIERYKEENNQK